jgi:uncharacterized membrane protein YhhN
MIKQVICFLLTQIIAIIFGWRVIELWAEQKPLNLLFCVVCLTALIWLIRTLDANFCKILRDLQTATGKDK